MTHAGQPRDALGTTFAGTSTSVPTQIASFTIDVMAVAAVAVGVHIVLDSALITALAVLEAFVILWVLEARTGLTLGNLILRVRHSRATAPVSPGAGRALVRQLVVGLGLAVAVVGAWVVAASGAWDASGRKRSLAARASGTVAVTPQKDKRHATAVAPQALPIPQAATAVRTQPPRGRTQPGAQAPAQPSPAAPPAPGANPVMVTSLEPVVPQAPPPAHTVPAPTIAPIPGARAPEPTAQPSQSASAQPVAAASPEPAAPIEATHSPVDQPTRSEPQAAQAGGLLLVFDTGQRATIALAPGTLDAAINLGRKPAPTTPADQLVIVQDPEGTVSKTHARIEHAHGQTWVIDEGSTNGTDLLDDEGATLLEPGARTLVDDGTRIRLGNRTLTVSVLLDAAPTSEGSA